MADAEPQRRCDDRRTVLQVHLFDLPEMLADVVRNALVAEAVTYIGGPPHALTSDEAVLVITARHDAADVVPWMHLWRRRPDVAVLVIEPRDGEGVLFEVWPRRRVLGSLSEGGIRAAATAIVPWDGRLPDGPGGVGG